MHDQGHPQNPYEFGAEPRPQSNTLGIVGFILSFCLSPIGLIVSLIALAKQPRGFAIGGVVIGLLGTGIWILCAVMGMAGFKLAKPMFETAAEIAVIKMKLTSYEQQNNGNAAADLATAGITGDTLTDSWGSPYQYSPGADGKSWTLTTLGPDQTIGTKDDGVITSTMSDAEIRKALEPMFEAGFRSQMDPRAKATISHPIDPAPADAAPAETKPAEPAPAPAGGTGGGGS